MNATPVITPHFALLWMLAPALICLLGIGIGIVLAFRRRDARVPLAIGGLGFVALLFSLIYASNTNWVQSTPTAFDHAASSPMNTSPVFTSHLNVVSLLVLALIVGAIVWGIVAAIRQGYTHAAAAIGVFAGICIVAMYYLKSHPGKSPETLGLLLMGGLFVVSNLGLGYIFRDGVKKGNLVHWGMCIGVVGIVAAMGLAGLQQSREETRRTLIQNDLRQVGRQLQGHQFTGLPTNSIDTGHDIMHAESEVALSMGVPIVSIVILLAIAIGIFAAIRQGYGRAVLGVGACLLVVGFLMFAIGFSRVSVQQPAIVLVPSEVPSTETARRVELAVETTSPVPTPTGPTPSQILYTTGNAQPIQIQELPAWRKNPPHEGSLGAGRAKYVLTSRQFATVDEAEAELFQSLAIDVQESFAQYNAPAVGWTPTPDDLRVSGIIAERVIETFSVKVGEFENPVHRVSWLIEFDHDKSVALLQRWQPVEAQRRSKFILTLLAGVSGFFGITAMALRRRRDQPAPLASGAA